VLLRLRDLKSAAAAATFSAAGLKPPPPPPPELLMLGRHGEPFNGWCLVSMGSPCLPGCLATPNSREDLCGNRSDFSRRNFRSLSTRLCVSTGASAEVLTGDGTLALLMSWKNLVKSQSLSSFCSSLEIVALAADNFEAAAAAAAAFYEFGG